MHRVYRKSASVCSKYVGYDEPDCEEILHAIFRLPIEVLWEVRNRKNLSSKRRLLIIRVVKLGILAFRRHGACNKSLEWLRACARCGELRDQFRSHLRLTGHLSRRQNKPAETRRELERKHESLALHRFVAPTITPSSGQFYHPNVLAGRGK